MRTLPRIGLLALLGAVLPGCPAGVRRPEPTSTNAALRELRDAAYRERFESDSFLIEHIELGGAAVGQNTFRASVTNRTGALLPLGLDLRAVPGLWFRPAYQRQSYFEVPAQGTLEIEAPYEFARLSSEAVLRVRIGGVTPAADDQRSVAPVFFERSYPVGRGNPDALDPRSWFDYLRTEHFDIFARKGSLAQSRIELIALEREEGLRQVEETLGIRFPGRIRLVFYADEATKTQETGHMGAGFAQGRTIIEVYNAEMQLDPYHEVAHIVAGELGNPPAFLDEGFATYMSERLGAPALRYLGSSDKTIEETVCDLAVSAELIPLSRLFRFVEIGSEESRPIVAYPQAASIVEYLIEEKGLAPFREAYGTLVNSDEPAQIERNEETFRRVFGRSLEEVEGAWRQRLRCPSRG